MSLNEQIQQLIQTFRETLPPELNTLIEQGAGEISSLPIIEKALKAGDKAPEFTLKNYDGVTRSLSDYLQNGPLVLTFYRGLWCPYCNLHLKSYNARYTDMKSLGAELVAISSEGPNGYETLENSNLPEETLDTVIRAPAFDVLHDANTRVAKQFGVAFILPEAHQKLLHAFGVDIEKANGNSTYAFADPATYIIGKDGMIAWAYVPNNYRKRAEVEDVLNQLRLLAKNNPSERVSV
ncbi:peroxiredoxin-like family protein [Methylomonas sp. UP202]|uniref:peroxiredoxin-like family protein n=1 Tax=Methylomonas sp. UP202 TaxID=3040943 RepID=UPI00247B096D|nr:peroxiredoxin-like family protein [Methylomonas sp. UP202]WGS83900.1 peroxiredoxin-like family protein [Methylomonas sp. UP202]